MSLAAVCLLGIAGALNSGASANSEGRVLTVEDILKTEDVGRILFVPGSRSLIFEWFGPYAQRPNVGTRVGPYSPAQATLLKLDFGHLVSPVQLFDQDPNGGYWLGSFSPNGTKLSIYRLVNDQLQAGILDLATNRTRFLELEPDCCALTPRPIWLSEETLIYPAAPTLNSADQEPFRSIRGRTATARRIVELWERAFDGRSSSATVLRSTRSGLHDAEAFPEGRLTNVDLASAREAELAKGQFYNLRLSPDRRYLAALKRGGRIQPSPTQYPTDEPTWRTQLTVIDVSRKDAKLVEPCPKCGALSWSVNWSADGSYLTFLGYDLERGREATELMRYRRSGELERVDIGNLELECRILFNGSGTPIGISDTAIAVFGRPRARDLHGLLQPLSKCDPRSRSDWFWLEAGKPPVNLTSRFVRVAGDLVGISEDAIFVLADGDVWKLQPGREPRNLTANIATALIPWKAESDTGVPRPLPGEPSSMLTVLQGDNVVLILDLDTGQYSCIEKPSPQAVLADLDIPSQTALFREDLPSGSRLLLVQKNQGAREILKFNEHRSQINTGQLVKLSYEVADGKRISSCMLLPPEWRGGKPYPTIVDVYPGRRDDFCAGRAIRHPMDPWIANPYLFAAQGYIVLFAAAPRELIRTPEGPTRGIASVVLAAVDQAIKEGYADRDRLGLFGISQGMHEVLQILTTTNRFKAAVAGFGLADFASAYGTMALRRRHEGSAQVVSEAARFESAVNESSNALGPMPWKDPWRYVDNSPVFHADRIETPVLLMHSDFDDFALSQTEEMFSALYRLRREADYVTYWGEGHGVASPANLRDAWSRIFAWYGRYLSAAQPAGPASTSSTNATDR